MFFTTTYNEENLWAPNCFFLFFFFLVLLVFSIYFHQEEENSFKIKQAGYVRTFFGCSLILLINTKQLRVVGTRERELHPKLKCKKNEHKNWKKDKKEKEEQKAGKAMLKGLSKKLSKFFSTSFNCFPIAANPHIFPISVSNHCSFPFFISFSLHFLPVFFLFFFFYSYNKLFFFCKSGI